MKRFLIDKKKRSILIAVFIIYLVVSTVLLQMHYPDLDTAIKSDIGIRLKMKVATVWAENGPIVIFVNNNNGLCDVRFHAISFKNQTFYRTAGSSDSNYTLEETIATKRNNTNKVFIKKEELPFIEKVAYGIGREWGEEYSKLTGLKANYVPFINDGKNYVLWYIVGKEQLEKVPLFRTPLAIFE